jgi:deoxyribodipyrimidine photo-lyase
VTTSVLWFRRDLRLADHPALLAAVEAAGSGGVVPLFVLDPALWEPAGPPRRVWLLRSLRALDASLGGGVLVVRVGDPGQVVADVAREAGAGTVHVTADAGPYGRRRDDAVAAALAAHQIRLVRTGTPYAVGPGSVLNGSGEPYKVFTPFFKAWQRHGWPAPAGSVFAGSVFAGSAPPGAAPAGSLWRGASGPHRLETSELPAEPPIGDLTLPDVGERAALERWQAFLATAIGDYARRRDNPDVDGTSGMSAHLKYGEIHPRTMLADLADLVTGGRLPASAREGVESLRSELCWREFYADVLWHRPDSARQYLRAEYAGMRYADPDRSAAARDHLQAWQAGRTGFPFVDAGMRQLQAVGWVHNRVRMVVASFLVKDLHLEWQHGARWFMRWLRDGDLASNQHGWQWVAGSGTDAAPYFRVFNPVSQGEKFDPDGDYVRRYVPELAHLVGTSAHTPWDAADGYAHGYPRRIVDHATERVEALARYAEIRGR